MSAALRFSAVALFAPPSGLAPLPLIFMMKLNKLKNSD
jgi:hypothetical protein